MDEIRRGNEYRLERDELPPAFVRFLESIFEVFGLTQGPVTIELAGQDGGFQFAFLKQRIRMSDLSRFQEAFDDTWRSLSAELAAP